MVCGCRYGCVCVCTHSVCMIVITHLCNKCERVGNQLYYPIHSHHYTLVLLPVLGSNIVQICKKKKKKERLHMSTALLFLFTLLTCWVTLAHW